MFGSFIQSRILCFRQTVFGEVSLLAMSLWWIASIPTARGQDCVLLTKVHENLAGFNLSSVAYGDGIWMAVGSSRSVLISDNGTGWMALDSGIDRHYRDLVWMGDRFVLFSDGLGPEIYLVTWSQANGFEYYPGLFQAGSRSQAIGWDGTNLIVAFYYGLFDSGFLAIVKNFSELTFLGAHCGEAQDIDSHGGLTVVSVECFMDSIAYRGEIRYSFDGVNFERQAIGPHKSEGAGGVATNGLVAFANGKLSFPDPEMPEYLLAHSPEIGTQAFTLYSETMPTFSTVMVDADWVTPVFAGVGPVGEMGYSTDGLSWTQIESPNLGTMRRIVPTEKNRFVAVGEFETIIIGDIAPPIADFEDWPLAATCLDLVRTQNCLAQ